AVLAVLVSVGLGSVSEGVSGSAVADISELSVKSISIQPQAYAGQTIRGTAIFSNTGSLSASFVQYKYEWINEYRNALFTTSDKLALIAGRDTDVTLKDVEGLPAGKYTVRITVDHLKEFSELDETNNVYEISAVIL
ncbi:MAG: hypothetical protein HY438_00180, partial [DPANN group archaeon]|nr:hypothetical protein [DPANN group archaeon]